MSSIGSVQSVTGFFPVIYKNIKAATRLLNTTARAIIFTDDYAVFVFFKIILLKISSGE